MTFSTLDTLRTEARVLLKFLTSDKPVVWTVVCLMLLILVMNGIYAVAALLDGNSSTAKVISEFLNPSRDGAFSETIAYGLSFSAFVLFLVTYIEHRVQSALFLAVLMAFIWFDDSASYHETTGEFLAENLDLITLPGLRAQDTGEVLAWGIAAFALVCVLLFCIRHTKPGDFGAFAVTGLAFLFLVFCGVFLDLLHSATDQRLSTAIGLMEDGGEMLALALIMGIALGLARNGRTYFSSFADA